MESLERAKKVIARPRLVDALNKLERETYKKARHVFTTSAYVRDNIVNEYAINPVKVTAVGTGIGQIRPYYGFKNWSKPQVLFVAKGRSADKGLDDALAAFASLRAIHPEAEMSIVGGAPLHKDVLPHGVTVHGYLSLSELQQLFWTHNCLLMPANAEPWGLVFLEAMAARLAVVALGKNAIPEMTAAGSLAFIPREATVRGISKSLIEVFDDHRHTLDIVLRAQAHVLERYSWQSTADKIYAVIRETVA